MASNIQPRKQNRVAQRLVAKYGGRRQAAEALDVTIETMRLWLRDGIPLERALDVEEKSERHVSAESILREARKARGATAAAP